MSPCPLSPVFCPHPTPEFNEYAAPSDLDPLSFLKPSLSAAGNLESIWMCSL